MVVDGVMVVGGGKVLRIVRTKYLSELIVAGATLDEQARALGTWANEAIGELMDGPRPNPAARRGRGRRRRRARVRLAQASGRSAVRPRPISCPLLTGVRLGRPKQLSRLRTAPPR
jgi:hypothetical protein